MGKAGGAIYEEFTERHIIDKKRCPPIERYCVGIDSDSNAPLSSLAGVLTTRIFLMTLAQSDLQRNMLNNEITRKWGDKQWNRVV